MATDEIRAGWGHTDVIPFVGSHSIWFSFAFGDEIQFVQGLRFNLNQSERILKQSGFRKSNQQHNPLRDLPDWATCVLHKSTNVTDRLPLNGEVSFRLSQAAGASNKFTWNGRGWINRCEPSFPWSLAQNSKWAYSLVVQQSLHYASPLDSPSLGMNALQNDFSLSRLFRLISLRSTRVCCDREPFQAIFKFALKRCDSVFDWHSTGGAIVSFPQRQCIRLLNSSKCQRNLFNVVPLVAATTFVCFFCMRRGMLLWWTTRMRHANILEGLEKSHFSWCCHAACFKWAHTETCWTKRLGKNRKTVKEIGCFIWSSIKWGGSHQPAVDVLFSASLSNSSAFVSSFDEFSGLSNGCASPEPQRWNTTIFTACSPNVSQNTFRHSIIKDWKRFV